jgi:hypothetical protein
MARSRAASHGACRVNNSRSAASSPPAIAAISSSSSIGSLLRSVGNRFTDARDYGNAQEKLLFSGRFSKPCRMPQPESTRSGQDRMS